jgi:hypothetical protein
MKRIARNVFLAGVLCSAFLGQSAISAEPVQSARADGLAPDATLYPFYRWYSPTPFMHRSDTLTPGLPFGLEETLGHVYQVMMSGAHPLYGCFRRHGGHPDYFTSIFVDCEGEDVAEPYFAGEWSAIVMDTQVTGTVPLYRCLLQNVYHFDSLQSNCEASGAVTEGVLGYIYH